jgi:hypothetical protein
LPLQGPRRTRCYLPARPGAFPLLPRFSISLIFELFPRLPLLPRFSIFLIFELFPRLPPVPLLVVSDGEPVAVGAAVDCEGGLLLATVVEGTVRAAVVEGTDRAARAANCEGGLLLATAVERTV